MQMNNKPFGSPFQDDIKLWHHSDQVPTVELIVVNIAPTLALYGKCSTVK